MHYPRNDIYKERPQLGQRKSGNLRNTHKSKVSRNYSKSGEDKKERSKGNVPKNIGHLEIY